MHRKAGLLVTLGIAVGTACSSSSGGAPAAATDAAADTSVGNPDAQPSDASTSSEAGPDASATHASPPPPGATTAPDGTSDVVFAITKIYYGDTDRDGIPDRANGWKNYGFDVDGKISDASSTDLCKPRSGATPKSVYPDGTNGIDNSWGKLILPIFLGIQSDYPSKANADLAAGKPRVLFKLQKLGTGASYNPLPSPAYVSSDLMQAPRYDGTDVFPVDPASLSVATDLTMPRVSFQNAYLTANTWVSDVNGMTLAFGTSSTSFAMTFGGGIPIRAARISMTLSADHKTATNGTVSGVISVADLQNAMRVFAGQTDPSLCTGPTIDSILEQLAQAADIMQDGTQDPTQTCDGISIGLGFDAAIVQIGSIGPATSPPPNPCADAGP